MSWNYRIVKVAGLYGVHEVYYDNKTKKPHSWSESAVHPIGETVKELQEDLFLWLGAFAKPALVVVKVNGKETLQEENLDE